MKVPFSAYDEVSYVMDNLVAIFRSNLFCYQGRTLY